MSFLGSLFNIIAICHGKDYVVDMKKTPCQNSIQRHYRQADLGENIRRAFDRAGRQIRDYTDTESIDEFHIRGREATREMVRLGDLKAGMNVLDLGCGIGGPARLLAAEYFY